MRRFRRRRREGRRYDLTIQAGENTVVLRDFASRDHAKRASESVLRYNPHMRAGHSSVKIIPH